MIISWKQWEWCEFYVVVDNTSLEDGNNDNDDDDITELASYTVSRDI